MAELKATNVRRLSLPRGAIRLLSGLRRLLHAEARNSFAIGDMVNQLRDKHRFSVTQIADILGASRQRLSELRRTAAAFPVDQRDNTVQFHFYTLSARTAARLGLAPAAVLSEVMQERLGSTRQATRYLARRIAEHENAQSRHRSLVQGPPHALVNAVHHADYRDIVPKLPDRSVQLVVADPPYGQYGRYSDGSHTVACATRREADNMAMAEAMEVTCDLFRAFRTKLVASGVLILFQPGGIPDRPKILVAAEREGWECRHALTWRKGHVQMGSGRTPYSIASEKLLVFCFAGMELINHDGSDRSDVLNFNPVRPTYSADQAHHLWEKPAALCRHLISKHTYEGQLVCEPFGGSGSISVAAEILGRSWICCETHGRNYAVIQHQLRRPSPFAIESAG